MTSVTSSRLTRRDVVYHNDVVPNIRYVQRPVLQIRISVASIRLIGSMRDGESNFKAKTYPRDTHLLVGERLLDSFVPALTGRERTPTLVPLCASIGVSAPDMGYCNWHRNSPLDHS
jgi:hypothetical protein